MKAVRNAPPTVEVVEIDEPDGPGELVRVASTGICASDLMYLRFGSTQIAGHEFAGVLEDGTPVAVEAIFGCAGCEECDQGNYNRCRNGVQGLGMMDPGGMCEWFRAPKHALIPLPTALATRDAALVEPGAVALHALNGAHVGDDTTVAVVGAGAIGILAAAGAQTLGAPAVAVEARHAHQHAARERIGVDTPSGEYDVVIETAGSDTGLRRAVELARPGGTVVILGIYETDTSWPHYEAFMREVALRPSIGYCGHHGTRDFAAVAEMLAARPELVDTLITHRFPIEDAPEAFRVASDRSQGVFRVVVEP
jgi:2-desacetyl-2-hydroxyethyl bacteriochlorophyllide A dehydrogenase